MGIHSPSKFMTRKQMRQILADHCIGESGKEYCEAELRHDLQEKETRLAALEAEKAFNDYHSQDLDNGGALPPYTKKEIEQILLTPQSENNSMIATMTKQPRKQRGDKMKKGTCPASQAEKLLGLAKPDRKLDKATQKANALLDKTMKENNKEIARLARQCRAIAARLQ